MFLPSGFNFLGERFAFCYLQYLICFPNRICATRFEFAPAVSIFPCLRCLWSISYLIFPAQFEAGCQIWRRLGCIWHLPPNTSLVWQSSYFLGTIWSKLFCSTGILICVLESSSIRSLQISRNLARSGRNQIFISGLLSFGIEHSILDLQSLNYLKQALYLQVTQFGIAITLSSSAVFLPPFLFARCWRRIWWRVYKQTYFDHLANLIYPQIRKDIVRESSFRSQKENHVLFEILQMSEWHCFAKQTSPMTAVLISLVSLASIFQSLVARYSALRRIQNSRR